MKFWFKFATIITFLAGMNIACSKAPHLKPGYIPPEEVALEYHSALRWQDYDLARAFIMPESVKEFDEFVKENSEKLHIVDLKINSVELTDDGYTSHIKITRSYYLTPSVTKKDEILVQTWKLVNGKWLLQGKPF